jgi:hypothetical protein
LVAQICIRLKGLFLNYEESFMKKYVMLAAVLSLVTTQVFAQAASVDSEVEAELDQMYGTTQAPQGAPAVQAQPQGNVQSGQPVYVNQAPAVQAQPMPVQKQPVTYIEASPLNKSRAEQMREARQQVEADTETKIVEKLEQSRIEDEKKRANVLFGDKLDNMNQPQQPVAPVAPAPVLVVPPTPEEPKESTRDIIREELQMAMTAEKEENPAPTSQKYFSAMAGVANYPDATNVHGNYLLGFSYGNKYNNVYAVEGTFIASNYSVDKLDGGCVIVYDGPYSYCAPPVVDVIQYSGAMAVKYYLMDSMVRPIVGGLAQFSYRTFKTEDYGYNTGTATSHAIDMGILTGADIEVSPTMSVGLDFRYMFNLSSRVNTTSRMQYLQHPAYGTPIEKLQYYTLSFSAKVAF